MLAPLPDPRSLSLAPLAPIPVTLVSGFLGSGKTTLLNRALRDPRLAHTAVIVNELGEIGVDHLLVESAKEDTVLLGRGCLCCAVQSDLSRTLRRLLERRERSELPRYERVLLESSGLADPGPILQTLMSDPLRLGPYALRALVTVVDARLGERTLARFAEARRQAALADVLALSKTDLVGRGSASALRRRLRAHSSAPLVDLHAPSAPLADLFLDPIDVRHVPAEPAPAAHEAEIVCVSRRLEAPVELARFEAWAAALLETLGDRLLRIKGLIPVPGEPGPLVFHAVQHVAERPRFLDTWPRGEASGRLVLIALDVGREQAEAALERLYSSAP